MLVGSKKHEKASIVPPPGPPVRSKSKGKDKHDDDQPAWESRLEQFKRSPFELCCKPAPRSGKLPAAVEDVEYQPGSPRTETRSAFADWRDKFSPPVVFDRFSLFGNSEAHPTADVDDGAGVRASGSRRDSHGGDDKDTNMSLSEIDNKLHSFVNLVDSMGSHDGGEPTEDHIAQIEMLTLRVIELRQLVGLPPLMVGKKRPKRTGGAGKNEVVVDTSAIQGDVDDTSGVGDLIFDGDRSATPPAFTEEEDGDIELSAVQGAGGAVLTNAVKKLKDKNSSNFKKTEETTETNGNDSDAKKPEGKDAVSQRLQNRATAKSVVALMTGAVANKKPQNHDSDSEIEEEMEDDVDPKTPAGTNRGHGHVGYDGDDAVIPGAMNRTESSIILGNPKHLRKFAGRFFSDAQEHWKLVTVLCVIFLIMTTCTVLTVWVSFSATFQTFYRRGAIHVSDRISNKTNDQLGFQLEFADSLADHMANPHSPINASVAAGELPPSLDSYMVWLLNTFPTSGASYVYVALPAQGKFLGAGRYMGKPFVGVFDGTGSCFTEYWIDPLTMTRDLTIPPAFEQCATTSDAGFVLSERPWFRTAVTNGNGWGHMYEQYGVSGATAGGTTLVVPSLRVLKNQAGVANGVVGVDISVNDIQTLLSGEARGLFHGTSEEVSLSEDIHDEDAPGYTGRAFVMEENGALIASNMDNATQQQCFTPSNCTIVNATSNHDSIIAIAAARVLSLPIAQRDGIHSTNGDDVVTVATISRPGLVWHCVASLPPGIVDDQLSGLTTASATLVAFSGLFSILFAIHVARIIMRFKANDKELKKARDSEFSSQARPPALVVAFVVATLALIITSVWLVGTRDIVNTVGVAYIEVTSRQVAEVTRQRIASSNEVLAVVQASIFHSSTHPTAATSMLNITALAHSGFAFPIEMESSLLTVLEQWADAGFAYLGGASGAMLGVGHTWTIDEDTGREIAGDLVVAVVDETTRIHDPLASMGSMGRMCYVEYLMGSDRKRNLTAGPTFVNCDYDLKQQEWYKIGQPKFDGDAAPRWGPIYRYPSRATVAQPRVQPFFIENKFSAVVAIDVHLSQLSSFMREMRPGMADSRCTVCAELVAAEGSAPLEAQAFIVDDRKCVIASSTSIALTHERVEDDGTEEFVCSPLRSSAEMGLFLEASLLDGAVTWVEHEINLYKNIGQGFVFAGNDKIPMIGSSRLNTGELLWHQVIVVPYWELSAAFHRMQAVISIVAVGVVFVSVYSLTVVMRLAFLRAHGHGKQHVPPPSTSPINNITSPALSVNPTAPAVNQSGPSPEAKDAAADIDVDVSRRVSQIDSPSTTPPNQRTSGEQRSPTGESAIMGSWKRVQGQVTGGDAADANRPRELRFEAALLHVWDALDARPLRWHHLDRNHVKAYQMYHYKWYFRAVVGTIMTHLLIGFWEEPSTLTKAEDQNRAIYDTLLSIEVMCCLVYSIDNALYIYSSGWKLMIYGKRWVKLVPTITASLMWLDIITAWAMGPGTFRYTRILRPVMLVLRVRGLKGATSLLLKTLMSFLDNVVLLISIICSSSVIGMALYRDSYGWQNDVYGFWNFLYAALTQFHLLTGEPYPDVLGDVAGGGNFRSQSNRLFFVLFIAFATIFFVPGIIAKFYELYKKERLLALVRQRAKQVVNLIAAFHILDKHNKGDISKTTFVNFLLMLGEKTGRVKDDSGLENLKAEALIKFERVDEDHSGTIDKSEFCNLCRSLLQQMEKTPPMKTQRYSWHKRWVLRLFFSHDDDCKTVYAYRPNIVFSNLANILVSVHILANAMNGAIYMSAFAQTWTSFNVLEGTGLDDANLGFLLMHLTEICIKVIAWGPRAYWKKGSFERFDVVIVVISMAMFLITAAVDQTSKMMQVAAVLPCLRVFTVVDSTQFVVKTFLSILPSVSYVGLLCVAVMYMFAIIGMELFSGFSDTLIIDEPRLGPAWREFYQKQIIGFDSLLTGMYTMFQLYLAANYTQVIYPLAAYYGDVAHLFFCTFIFIGFFLLSNLFIGMVLDAYVFKLSISESEADEFQLWMAWQEMNKPDNVCFICHKELDGKLQKILRPFDCMPNPHAFHRACIMHYDYKRGECPQCRVEENYGRDMKLLDPDNVELELEMFGGAVQQQVGVPEVESQFKSYLRKALHNARLEIERQLEPSKSS